MGSQFTLLLAESRARPPGVVSVLVAYRHFGPLSMLAAHPLD